jgi:hypothetical protein
MKTKNNNQHKREQLPFKSPILLNPASFFISKHEITLKHTEAIRSDIKALMKEKNIGWAKLSRLLKDCRYDYKPNAIQNYVNGNTKNAKDISYFVPIVILLIEIKIIPYF